MQGLILAAGMGKRLKSLTANNTKCMVKVNGVTLIERTLHSLDKFNLNKIVIVVGYKAEELIDYITTLNVDTPIEYVMNSDYANTNNIFSLSLAKNYLLEDDTLLLESDIIFEDSVLQTIIDDNRDTLALVDKYQSWMDGTCLKLNRDDFITDFISSNEFNFDDSDNYYKTVNIYKFSKHFSETHYVPFLDAYCKALGTNEYYEQVLQVISMLPNPVIKAKRLDGQKWYEIDDIQDLDIAESLFRNDSHAICSRYGGYWRYPDLLDFCYLVNPYFPNDKLKEEMKSSFDELLTQYPSGLNINNVLASRNFGINENFVIVGNGASELINHMMLYLYGTVGFIRPTFEEYPNRYFNGEQIVFAPNNRSFTYSVDDLIHFYGDKKLNALVLINPDNPSGNYIDKPDLLRLITWCHKQSIMIIVDESFSDFADCDDSSLLHDDILSSYSNLVVVKSISKSYGVPGLRLGILASSNYDVISYMKSQISIWNINSFGEFYMQISNKYQSDYMISLSHIRETRKHFIEQLSDFDMLRVIPSQANFLLIELLDGLSAEYFTSILFERYNILVKDLSSKIYDGEYIRVAIRNEHDNDVFIHALHDIFDSNCNPLFLNKWQEVWNNRPIDITKLSTNDEFQLYSELKRLDGFDVQIDNENAYYKNFYNSILDVYNKYMVDCFSVYEVGCGSGANLLLFKNRGKYVNGIDYSNQLASVARNIVGENIVIDEAINMNTDDKYDVVISDSVFAYFSNIEYGMSVLRKMYDKSKQSIILLEIFDKACKEECIAYRRSKENDYDMKYVGLDKTFYPKQMFIDFADSHNCDIIFTPVVNDSYWNSRYMYNCIITKRS